MTSPEPAPAPKSDAAPALVPASTVTVPGDGRRKRAAPPRPEAPTTRELPNSPELERAVLAVLLDGRHATAIHTVRQVVSHPLAFFQRDHRIVYLACLELDDGGHRVEAGAVGELLSRYDFRLMIDRLRQHEVLFESGELDRIGKDRLRTLYGRRGDDPQAGYQDSALSNIGGYNALTELTASHAFTAGLERNAILLWDTYLKRRLIQALQNLCTKAYRTPDAFPKLIDEGSQALLDLGRHNQSVSVHAMGSVINETIDEIQRRQDNPSDGLTTGIPGLDQRLGTLRPGGLYILAARPGAGKTTLALSIVSTIAKRSDAELSTVPVLFFSLEVDRIDLAKKMLAADANIDFKCLDTGVLQDHEHVALTQSATRFKTWAVDLMDVSDLNVHAMRSVVKRRMLETAGALGLVVIDYLQLLSGSRGDQNEYEKVSEISRVLKVLAREMRIPIIALSQMSRDSEKGVANQPREPRLSDLRGSGTVEQDADAVIFIHRVDEGEGDRRKMKLILAKNRFGPTGYNMMDFYPSKMRFEPAAADGDLAPDDGRFDKARMDRLNSKPDDSEDPYV